MRVWTNGRGCHPRIRSTTLHQWTLDESAAADAARDIIAAEHLPAIANPPVLTPASAAPGGPSVGLAARQLNGTTQAFGPSPSTGADAAALTGAGWTIIASVRLRSSWAGLGTVLTYGASGETLATNVLAEMRINASRQLAAFWENGAGVDNTATLTTVTLPVERWLRLAVVRSGTTVSFYVDGGLAGTASVASAPAGGTSARWQAGSWVAGGNYVSGDIESITVDSTALTAAEIEEDFRRMAGLGFASALHARARVGDVNGDLQDLTDLLGHDWLKAWNIRGDVDGPGEVLDLELWKRRGSLSLAPLTNNALNRVPLPSATYPGVDHSTYGDAFTGAGTATELLTPRRFVQLEVCRLPLGLEPATDDWQVRFQGFLDEPEWGGEEDELRVSARDISGLYADAWMTEVNKTYGTEAGRTIQNVLQDIVDDAAAAAVGSTFQLADPTGFVAVTSLGVEGSPTAVVYTYNQIRQPVVQALQAVADQCGWVVRTRWDYATEAFKLTLVEPERTRSHPCIALTADQVRALPGLRLDLANVRNHIRLVYFPTGETASTAVPSIPTGTTTQVVGSRPTYEAGETTPETDPVSGDVTASAALAVYEVNSEDLHSSEAGHKSLSVFGARTMEVVEPASSPIRTIAQAQAMAVALLRDLCLPKAQASFDALAIPELEVGDFVRLQSALHSDQSVDGGITQVTHENGRSNVQARGLPSGGYARHLEKEGAGGNGLPPPGNMLDARATMSRRVRQGVYDAVVRRAGIIKASRNALLANIRFQARSFGETVPPDGWAMDAGVWGTDALLDTANAELGTHALYLKTGTAVVCSELIPCAPSQVFVVDFRAKAVSSTPTLAVRLRSFTAAGASITTSAITQALTTSWVSHQRKLVANSSARYVRFELYRSAGTTEIVVGLLDALLAQPSVRAYRSSTFTLTKATWQDVVFNNDSTSPGGWDEAALFDTTTGVFTAPATGIYNVTARLECPLESSTAVFQLRLRAVVNGTAAAVAMATGNTTDSYSVELHTGDLLLTAGDTLKIQAYVSTSADKTVSAGADVTYVSIRRVSPE